MRIEFLVEEPSMKVLLDHLLQRLLPNDEWEVFDFRSKEQLLLRLPQRLKGYASMISQPGYENLRVVVLVDRDNDDCQILKARLEGDAHAAGLCTLTASRATSNASPTKPFYIVNRVVCEELEAWYFGDPAACQAAYNRLKPAHFSATHLHDPDGVKGGTWEAFGRTLNKAGHLPATPANHRWKYEAAEAIGPHLSFTPSVNKSPSFQAFIAGVLAIKNT